MQIKKVLNSKEIKKIEEILYTNYLSNFRLRDYFVFVTSDDKVWIINKDIEKLDLSSLKRINFIGLYFGKLKKGNKIKLSIEGCQLVSAKKNVVIIDEENMKMFLQGSDVNGEKIDCELNNFVILKYGNDFIGTGILREDKVENLLSKSRRIVL